MSDTAIAAAGTAPAQVPATHPSPWKDPKGFGFRDLIDIVNPLQHLPIIGSIYRWMTGDRPGEAAQMAGDALYGGPIGIGVSLLSASLQDEQGHDLGERVIAYMFGPDAKATAVAAAQPAGAASPGAAQPGPGAAAALPPATPDHAPMPLYGGMTLLRLPVAPAPAQPQAQGDPAKAFLAHNAALERQLAAVPRTPRTAPVPLVVPPGSLEPPHLAAAPSAPGAPLDVSHKMLDALDKYMQLEQQRKARPATPDAPAPAGVDLSL
jgi:hypothetical protein